jgi:hypothetical protein
MKMELELLYIIPIWVLLSIAVADAAKVRFKRSWFNWFLVSLLASPLAGGLLLALYGPQPQRKPYIDWNRMSQPRDQAARD